MTGPYTGNPAELEAYMSVFDTLPKMPKGKRQRFHLRGDKFSPSPGHPLVLYTARPFKDYAEFYDQNVAWEAQRLLNIYYTTK